MTRKPALSAGQRRIWLQEQIGGAPGATYSCLAALLTGSLDADLLQAAFGDVARRHEVLRWVYRDDGGEPVPVARDAVPTIERVDLRDRPPGERLPRAHDLVAERNRRPFDLRAEGPVRAVLVRTADNEHLLAFTLHRIAFDEWSTGVFATELSEAYTARRRGRPAKLAELPAGQPDDTGAAGPVSAADREYWRRQLADVPHVLDLPVDRPRPLNPRYRGDAVPFDLGADASAAVRSRGGGAVRATLLATFAALAHRCGAAADVILGVPVDGRATPGAERLIGSSSDLAPVRVDLAGDPDLDTLVARVVAAHRDATAHSRLSFEQIVEAVAPQRIPGQPLVQAMVAVREHAFRLDLDGVDAVPVAWRQCSAQVDLAVDVLDAGGSLAGFVEFNQELFDAATVTRLVHQWQVLARHWLARPATPLSQVSMLTDSDEHDVLRRWNATARPVPARSLDELFREQVARHPDRVALVTSDGEWTYRWLAERSAAVAAHLTRLGVGFEEPVAIGLPRSPDYFVAVLAVLRCGATFLALDPGYPADRLRYMVRDSGARVLLTARDLVGSLPADGLDVVFVAETDGVADDLPEPPTTPASAVAYLIYTSGSSGVPKAVMGTHAATVNRLSWMWSTYPFAAGEVCSQKASPCFGDSIWETFGGLLHGVPTLVLGDDEVRNPDRFVAALAAAGVTRCTLVPSMLWLLVDRPDVPAKLSRLRLLVSSGEALETELADRFRRALPDCTLLNLYGSSELAADVTVWDCAEPADRPAVPIGRPIANAAVYVLDRRLRPVPVGVAGEAFVGGAGLARGYADRPGMTAERFLPNPYGPGRLYRTGDRCVRRADGVLEYLGRLDDQVKVRGMRVEPAEVEAAVARHPGVAGCAVVGRTFGPGDVRLVCFVVPVADAPVSATAAALRRFARAGLPEFMVPSMFVTVPELPQTASGKVDRRALPLPAATGSGGTEPAPDAVTGGTLEQRVAAVWAEVLGVDRVGPQDNFFELGGDSLRLMHLARRLSATLDRPVGLGTLYVNQSVEGLCRALAADSVAP